MDEKVNKEKKENENKGEMSKNTGRASNYPKQSSRNNDGIAL